MSRITIQMGHVARRSGVIGTYREQEFVSAVGPRLRDALRDRGHQVALIGADDAVPVGDVFVALHCDGSANTARRGASVGYPSGTNEGRLAKAWKARHQEQGYPGGWLADNYTAALRGYYGFGRARGYDHEFLAEHGTTTNRLDVEWLFANIDRCVAAHVNAIGDVVGHPISGGQMLPAGNRMLRVYEAPHMLSGDDVRKVQEWAGVTPVDGIYGNDTAAAVRVKQAAHGLEADGVVGPATWAVVLAPVKPGLIGAIADRFSTMPDGLKSMFGETFMPETPTPDGVGRYNHFGSPPEGHASIYWHPETGAYEIYGKIRTAWAKLGWEAGELGYPVTGEFDHAEGRQQHFQRGFLTWNAQTEDVFLHRWIL